MGVESGHAIGNSLAILRTLYRWAKHGNDDDEEEEEEKAQSFHLDDGHDEWR